jgi:phosphoribosylanthranilate isomerase
MTKPVVKVSGINSLTDARYCAGMEVPYLGIQFDAEGNCLLDRNSFTAIAGWIEGPVWVGEYEGHDEQKLLELADSYGIEIWQVVSKKLVESLSASGKKAASKMEFKDVDNDILNQPNLCYLLISNDVQTEQNHEALRILSEKIQVFVEPISNYSEMESWIQQNPKVGFNLYSGAEDRPGWMDLSGLQDILEAMDEA